MRELRNLLERLVILQGSAEAEREISRAELDLHMGDAAFSLASSAGDAEPLPKGAVALSTGRPLKDDKSEFKREYILQALKENGWNVSKTAQSLGIERSYLHRRMKVFGIEGE